ncbi:hypothetical protein MTY59_44960 [Mycobacterium senriense]|uniref:Secreted protein n=1 Tax=Mycobacterium senriense TaxID=2775496 RepID=A0ABN6IQD5_9MYCO|nr:hypothetical protein MTY59_44960 [Mycobacterium senriense]
MMWARSEGAGAGGAVLGCVATAGWATSMTIRSKPSNLPARSAVVTAAIGAASVSMNSTRVAGSAGSIGRYAAPDLSTARIDTIASAERENSSATNSPGPAPRSIRTCANWLAASSSSRYVIDRSWNVSATASGVRAACAANSPATVTGSIGSARTASLPHVESWACSAVFSRSTEDNRRSGSAVTAVKSRCSRSIIASTVSALNTSVRYSAVTAMPARCPASVKRSASENVRSMRAVSVCTGIGVTCRSPSASPAAGVLTSPGKFSQPNST